MRDRNPDPRTATAGVITELLHKAIEGDESAVPEIIEKTFHRLQEFAGEIVGARRVVDFDSRELIDEFYRLLVADLRRRNAGVSRARGPLQFDSRQDFYKLAYTAMKNRLLDHLKSPPRQRETELNNAADYACQRSQVEVLLDIRNAVEKLAQSKPRAAKVVQLCIYNQMSSSEAAELLGICERTVRGDMLMAKTFLKSELVAYGQQKREQ